MCDVWVGGGCWRGWANKDSILVGERLGHSGLGVAITVMGLSHPGLGVGGGDLIRWVDPHIYSNVRGLAI